MEKDQRQVRFIGGPLDGQSRHIDADLTRYEVDEPGRPQDLHAGEVPVAFYPPFHKYVYVQNPADEDSFVYTEEA